MSTSLVRPFAFGLAVTAQMVCCDAQEFYVAQKNAVYVTEARQLHLDDSVVPLALIRVHWGWLLAVFHPRSHKVETLEFSDVCKLVGDPGLRPESIIVSEEKLYQKIGTLRFFKKYPTDAYDGSVDVSALPLNNRIFVTMSSPQTEKFEGSTCIVTNVTTKRDVHVAHRISQVYNDDVDSPLLTWISDRTILAFEYTYRGNGGYYIDTKTDTRTEAWSAVDHAQYFSFDGEKLTLYVPNGDHFNATIATNFASVHDLFPQTADFMLTSEDRPIQATTLAFQPLN